MSKLPPPERRNLDRRTAANRRRTPVSRDMLTAPFGAQLLGQDEPCPLSAQGVIRAYMQAPRLKSANDNRR